MNPMILSGRLQRGQVRGSASYTFLIRRAHERLMRRAHWSCGLGDGIGCSGGGQISRALARRTWDHSP